jgi:hypothetical protein
MSSDSPFIEIPVEDFRLKDDLSHYEKQYGGEPGEIDVARIRIRIGRQPLAVPLESVAALNKPRLPEDYDKLLRAYDPWMVTYGIGIQDTGSTITAVRFGLRIRFVNRKDVSVASVFPETRLIDLGSGEFQAGIGVNGHLDPDILPGNILSSVGGGMPIPGFDAKFSSSGKADVALNLKFRVLSPNIVATGIHDDESAWTITRDQTKLLVGDQILGHVIFLPKHTRGPMTVRATLFVDVGLIAPIFTWRFISEPIDLEVPLMNSIGGLGADIPQVFA